MTAELVHFLRNVSPGYHPGWGGPEYTNWRDEQMSWKRTCYIGDWSFLWDLVVKGPDALKLFSDLSVNSFAKFDIGQAKHLIQCHSTGKVVAEGILMRLAEDEYITQSITAFWTGFKLESGNYDATASHVKWFKYQVSGPNALTVVEKAAGESLRDIGFMRFRPVTIAGHQVLALRQGMAGEIGFELQGPIACGPAVYDAVLAAGQDYGIRRLGRRTAMINHLEACFPTGAWHYLPAMFGPESEGYPEYIQQNFDTHGLTPVINGSFAGSDISDYYRSPVELGWAKNIKFDHDFTGRAALEAEIANPKRKVVTLEFDSDDMIDIYASLFRDGEPYDFMDMPHPQRWVMWADTVLKDGAPAGISSVPGYSYYFRKILSLAFLDIEFADPGTQVTIVWGNPGTPQKQVRATVAPAPYKKDNRRADLTAAPVA